MSLPTTEQEEITAKAGFHSLFKNQQFMALWIAQIFSQFADRAVFVLFVAVLTAGGTATIAGRHFGAAQLTSDLYVAFTIPAILLSPVAGVYVDRWSNKAVLCISNLVRACLVCLIGAPFVKESPVAAFGLAFLISIGSQFFAPAESSSIPRLVKKEELYAANSLFFTTMMIALGFGFAIGDPIVSATGIGKAPYAVACGFFLAGLFVLRIKDNKRVVRHENLWWEDLRIGIAYIANNAIVFKAILKITFLFSTMITLNVIAVALSQQVMHLEASKFGYIVAAAGVGMGIGNFIVGHYLAHINPSLMAHRGFSLLGLFMSLLGSLGFIQEYVFPSIGMHGVYFNGPLMFFPLLLAAMIGLSSAFVAVPTQSLLQASIPEDMRGKVFAAQNTAMSAASTIPVVLAGISADNIPGGVSTTLLIVGLPTLVMGLVNHARSAERIKRLDAGK